MATTSDGPIQGTTLALTQVSGGAATITALGTAAVALFAIGDSDSQAVRVAKIAAAALIVAAGLIATAWIVASDLRARAIATAGTGASASTTPAATAAGTDAKAAAGRAGVWVKVADKGDDLFLIVQAEHLEHNHTRYLVARDDEKPEWVNEHDIGSWAVLGAGTSSNGS